MLTFVETTIMLKARIGAYIYVRGDVESKKDRRTANLHEKCCPPVAMSTDGIVPW